MNNAAATQRLTTHKETVSSVAAGRPEKSRGAKQSDVKKKDEIASGKNSSQRQNGGK
ncbi:MAG TPA: hypothetical protein VGA95_12505 [Thermodesulfobacteriota bacterium]|jgi:hypothetical protein